MNVRPTTQPEAVDDRVAADVRRRTGACPAIPPPHVGGYARWIFPVTLMASLLATGCTSKSKAQANAAKAFRAGQAQATMAAEAKQNGISFSGQVLNPIVPWTEGLTLAHAIVAAGWNGLKDPRLVIVTRAGERVELTPNESVAAAELPLEPGDAVELVP